MITVSLIENFLYFLCIYCVSVNIFLGTPKNKTLLYVTLFLYVQLIITSLFFNQPQLHFINVIVKLITIFLIKLLVKNVKFKYILGFYILLYSINIILASTILLIIYSRYISYGTRTLVDFIVNMIVTISCMAVCKNKKICKKIHRVFSSVPHNVKLISLSSFVVSAFLVFIISDINLFFKYNSFNISVRVSLICLVILVGITFPVFISKAFTSVFYEKLFNNLEANVKMQSDHYKALSKSNFQLRVFRHDFNNIKIGVTKLLDEGRIEEAKQMLNDCSNKLNTATKSIIKFETGNEIVDAILSEKQEKATTINTVIAFEGSVSSKYIESIDLCIIFGNTLDNAIEACEKSPIETKKVISVSCRFLNGFMFLKITNPTIENVTINNNIISTSKPDKSSHGFGLKSISKIVEKYNGEVNIECKNLVFSIKISLEF